MKKVSILMSVLLVFGILFTYSCTKDDSDDDGGGGDDIINLPVKTRLLEHNDFQAIDSTFRAFGYNERKLVEKEVWRDKNNVAFKVIKHEYNSSDKLIRSLEYQDEAMTIVASNTMYTLDGSGLAIKSVNDRGGNITTTDYTYNSGRLAKAHIEYTGASAGDPEEMEYVWTGDNITKVTYLVPDTIGGTGFVIQGYEEFEYDAKTNPYFDIAFPSVNPMELSKNNIKKIREYDSFNVIQHLTTYTYTSYEGDLPKMAFYDIGYQQGVYEYKYKDI
ncbi:MAG: hypothetical protein DRI84_04975 [Bacteroidetes bacterium]|nr:MAG: hypothetical protein DRI84_04975 [Bacteroidota bacterium]